MASTPRSHGNGWRVQWQLKGTKDWQYKTFPSDEEAWKFKYWIEAKDHRYPSHHEDLANKLYLVEQLPAASHQTFGDFAEAWIGRRSGANEDSREAYRKIRRRCVDLLDLPLGEITRPRAAEYIVALRDGKTSMKRKYAENTVRETAIFIRSVMLEAEDYQAFHPGPGMSLRLLRIPQATRLRPHRYLDEDEYGLIRAAAYDQQTRDVNDLMVLTGLRIGEALPLEAKQWKRTPGDGGFLLVDHHARRTGAPTRDGTKGNSEGRRFWVNESGAELLDRLVADSETGGLFPARMGGVWHYSHWVISRWKPTIHRALGLGLDPGRKGLPTPHDLRHTHVDLCLKRGCGLDEIQGRLGHSSINVTIDQYGRQGERRGEHYQRDHRGYEGLTLPPIPSSVADKAFVQGAW